MDINCKSEIRMLAILLWGIFFAQYCSALEEIADMKMLHDFRSQDKPHALFYYHHNEKQGKQFRSILAGMMETADELWMSLREPHITLGIINCLQEEIKNEDIEECSKGHKVLYAYRKGKQQVFDLKTLYSQEAFVGQMLYFVHEDDIGLAQNQDDWKYETNEQKGKKDIVFMYFTGLGDIGHYALMSFAAGEGNMDKYKFVISTERNFALSMGMGEKDNHGLWVATCSKATDSTKCPLEKYSGYTRNIDIAAITSFVKLNGKPLVAELNKEGSSIYGDDNSMTLFFVFVDNDSDKKEYTAIIERVAKNVTELGTHIRGVIVDKRTDAKYLRGFGIFEDTILPTAVLEIVDRRLGNDRQFEIFSPDSDFTEENILKFLAEMKESDTVFEKMADLQDIEVVKLEDWKNPTPNRRKVLAAACSKDSLYEIDCTKFSVVVRRLVRTLFVSNVLDIEYVYVNFDGKPRSAEANNIPSLRLYIDGTEHRCGKGIYGYETIVEWINKVLGLDLKILPASGGDFVALPNMQIDENEENLLGDDDRLKSMEDDEVTKYALKYREKTFYEDKVEQLTDQTFNSTLQKYELVVVFFHVPWDDTSYLFHSVYAKIHEKLGVDTEGSTISTKIAKVNCYDAFLVCATERMNIYPTISAYKNGKHVINYDGVLDEFHLTQAIRSYQLPRLIKLSEHDCLAFMERKEPMPAVTAVSTSVLAWFEKEDEAFKLFKEVAEQQYGKCLFGYAVGNATKEVMKIEQGSYAMLANQFGKKDRFDEEFNKLELNKFVAEISMPSFGELTATNFPMYKSLNLPFLILFTKHQHSATRPSTIWKSLEKIVQSNKHEKILPAWMDTEKPVTKLIRRNYLGACKEGVNELVIVNHTTGHVYLFQGPNDVADIANEIFVWVNACQNNAVKPITFLHAAKEWKPLRKGFNYLKFIEKGLPRGNVEEEEEIEKNEEKGNYGHYKPADRVVLHGVKAPKNSKNPIDIYESGPGELPDHEDNISGQGGDGIHVVKHAPDEL